MIILKYSLTPEDHYKFNYYRFWQSPSQKKSRLRLYLRLIFYMVLVIAFIQFLNNRPFSFRDLSVAGILILVACLLYPEVYRYSLKKRVNKLLSDEKNVSYLALTEHIINEEGIYTRDDYSESKYNWSSFVSKEETKDYYYLFVDSLKAIAIPKRVFSSEGERNQFESYLSRFFPVKAEFENLKQAHNIH